jgi:hypothetical protein
MAFLPSVTVDLSNRDPVDACTDQGLLDVLQLVRLNNGFVFAAVAYFLSGLFVTELVRKHEMVTAHLESIQLEQSLRRQVEEQLRFLVEAVRRQF